MKKVMTKALYEKCVKELEERIKFKHMRYKNTVPFDMSDLFVEKSFDLDDIQALSREEQVALKAAKYLYENDEDKGELKRTIVLNTYNWMDSYGDVHLNGTFARSLQGRGKTAPHLKDHKFETDSEVGEPIKFEERSLSWRELGAAKTGRTQALVMESIIKRSMNEKIYNRYLAGKANQHSVCMQYVDIKLAADDEEEYPKEFALWKEILPLLGNRKEAEEQGFFFVVREAKLIEGSVVLMGANELTPTLGQKPSTDTSDTEEEKTRQLGTQLQAEKQESLRRLEKVMALDNLKSIV